MSIPRREMPMIVTVEAEAVAGSAGKRARFHTLIVRAYREWESGWRNPEWLRRSTEHRSAD